MGMNIEKKQPSMKRLFIGLLLLVLCFLYAGLIQFFYTIGYVYFEVNDIVDNLWPSLTDELSVLIIYLPFLIWFFVLLRRYGITMLCDTFLQILKKHWLIFCIYFIVLYFLLEGFTVGYYVLDFGLKYTGLGFSSVFEHTLRSGFILAYAYRMVEELPMIVFYIFAPLFLSLANECRYKKRLPHML